MLGGLLLLDESPCKLAYLRCDAFALLPSTTEFATVASSTAASSLAPAPGAAEQEGAVAAPPLAIPLLAIPTQQMAGSLLTTAAAQARAQAHGQAGQSIKSAPLLPAETAPHGGASTVQRRGRGTGADALAHITPALQVEPSQPSPLAFGALMLLAGVVRHNSTLKTLRLVGAGVDSELARALAAAIRTNTVLDSLDLSQNSLLKARGGSGEYDHSGLEELTRAIAASASLTSVTLNSTSLPVRQCNGSEATSTLDLSGLHLGFFSCMLLARLLPAHGSLAELCLQGNEEMGPSGCCMVVESLQGHRAMRGLTLSLLALESDAPADGWMMTNDSASHATRLAALFQAIGQMRSLERLALDHNGLRGGESLASICLMGALQRLALNNNRLAALPHAIGQLSSLIELHLHNNALTFLPESFGKLQCLVRLHAQNNLLVALPGSFGQLSALKVAALSYNRLSSLPPSIADLVLLEKLEVARNPLEKPPIMVVRQGLDAIRKYFCGEESAQ